MSRVSLDQTSNSLSYVRPVLVTYVRKQGFLPAIAAAAWVELRQLLSQNAIGNGWTGYGLLHGSIKCPEEMIFDACAEHQDSVVPPSGGELATQTILGGVHIASVCLGSHRSIGATFSGLMGDPLIGHGLSVADDRPAILTYTRTPSAGSRNAWALTLNMPLRWSNERQGQAA